MHPARFRAQLVLATLLILGAGPAAAQVLPASPAPAAVSLPAASTAVVVLDMAQTPCGPIPACVALVPRVAALVAAARRAGAFVAYSSADPVAYTAPTTQPPFLAPLAPANGDPVIAGGAQDRFYGSLLDQILRKHGIATVVLAGWRENGSVLYTAVGATTRGYTVVVADDATSASRDYDVAVGRYQLLTQLNANPTNQPLKKGTVTLSRTDLIAFR